VNHQIIASHQDSESEENEEEKEREVCKPLRAGAGRGKVAVWDWKKELFSIVKNISGLKKLLQDKPNTAAVGNWAVLQVVSKAAEWMNLGSLLRARLFMGVKVLKKSIIDVPISKRDSNDEVSAQWAALRYSTLSTNPDTLPVMLTMLLCCVCFG
jgi:hypothetical protein